MMIIDPIESGSWDRVCKALTRYAFCDNIYIHEEIFGGQKSLYSKLGTNQVYDFENREREGKSYYSINKES